MKSDVCLALHYPPVQQPPTNQQRLASSILPTLSSSRQPMISPQQQLQQQGQTDANVSPNNASTGSPANKTTSRAEEEASTRDEEIAMSQQAALASSSHNRYSTPSSASIAASSPPSRHDDEHDDNDSDSFSTSSSSSSFTTSSYSASSAAKRLHHRQGPTSAPLGASRPHIQPQQHELRPDADRPLSSGAPAAKRTAPTTKSPAPLPPPPPPPPTFLAADTAVTVASASSSLSGTTTTTTTKAHQHGAQDAAGQGGGGRGSDARRLGDEAAAFSALVACRESDVRAEALQLHDRHILFTRLEASAPLGKLSLINLSRQRIGVPEALLLKQVIQLNPRLSVLKLAYNGLGDQGAAAVASALRLEGHSGQHQHHVSLTVLDLSFNEIGDAGCEAIAVQVLAGNNQIRTLCLTANKVRTRGAMAIAGAVAHGTGLTRLLLSANAIRSGGIKALAIAIAKRDAERLASLAAAAVGDNISTTVLNMEQQLGAGMEELDVGGTSIDSTALVAIPGMLLTNATLQTLCLENNNINDGDMVLLSQALAQNKSLPLRTLKLSFNRIGCPGVECLMNAIWGSPTMRHIALDSNKVQDRGAQLCAVVLTSIDLERLDLSFNRVTTVGVKALMKNVAENNSLQTLGLSGIPIDLNGSKAVSFALAYNCSLRAVYLDNCSTGYSSQRHIVAGIVSNRRSSLRVLTGFAISPVARTLGIPNLPELWSNDQVLGFFRLMWQQWLLKCGRGVAPSLDDEAVRGPAPPAAVASAAKITLSSLALGTAASVGAAYVLQTEDHNRPVTEGPPVEPMGSALLERTDSGTMRVPPIPDAVVESVVVSAAIHGSPIMNAGGLGGEALGAATSPIAASSPPTQQQQGQSLDNPERRRRNLQWLRQHFRSLGEIGRLPFCNADLWQLHQYYFSPPFSVTHGMMDDEPGSSPTPFSSSSPVSGESLVGAVGGADVERRVGDVRVGAHAPPPTPALGLPSSRPFSLGLGRAVSFQALGDALAVAAAASGLPPHPHPPPPSHPPSSSHKRRAWKSEDGREHATLDGREGLGDAGAAADLEGGPSAKKRPRAIVGKPRIAYYPRVMAKVQSLGSKPLLEQSLSLLRQLKYVENVIFAGRDPYAASAEAGASRRRSALASDVSYSSASSSPSPSSSPSSTPSPHPLRRPPPLGDDSASRGRAGDPDPLLWHADVEMILLDLL